MTSVILRAAMVNDSHTQGILKATTKTKDPHTTVSIIIPSDGPQASSITKTKTKDPHTTVSIIIPPDGP